MAGNKPVGDNRRIGSVKKRSQLKTKMKVEEYWTKRSKESGQFMEQKKGKTKFKGVRRDKGSETVHQLVRAGHGVSFRAQRRVP